MRTDLGNSATRSNVITFILQESQKKKREKGAENSVEELIAKNFPNLGKETYPDPGGTENSHQNQQKQGRLGGSQLSVRLLVLAQVMISGS